MSEYDLGVQIDNIIGDAVREDPRIAEEYATVHTANQCRAGLGSSSDGRALTREVIIFVWREVLG